ncbi:MAG: P1 family peptidase [Bacteroidota bacterium]|nr:P1 family peptidase [Flavisolibacter sp.]MBD0375016.1 P1 family peptidase [Flavisolibacter sp.]MDQ3843870.1 P1 family peptidase [Bacteroidota bacterium]
MRFLFIGLLIITLQLHAQMKRARDYGIIIGVLPTGTGNEITDVAGVKVGHTTIQKGNNIRTGVTAVLPHQGNIFQQKVPAAFFVGNGFGKLTGSTQVQELGQLETPIVLTNTLSVPIAMDAVIDYILKMKGNEEVRSVNALVGETNDGWLNEIRGRYVTKEDVLQAIEKAKTGKVEEGSVGAGTGTVCFGYKGGIGTASRKLPAAAGSYTVGVLVQTNFGGVLQINGAPVGEELNNFYLHDQLNKKEDGSCMIIVATDAPIDSRTLERLAKRAFMGLAKTGGIAHNGSGDYVIAFSTDPSLRIAHDTRQTIQTVSLLQNDAVSPLFMAAIEATEEAIINSLLTATSVTGKDGHKAEALPIEKVLSILKKYNRIKK